MDDMDQKILDLIRGFMTNKFDVTVYLIRNNSDVR